MLKTDPGQVGFNSVGMDLISLLYFFQEAAISGV